MTLRQDRLLGECLVAYFLRVLRAGGAEMRHPVRL